MSAVATPVVPSPPAEPLLTIADVAVLPSDLPSGPVQYELDDGRLDIMPPPGDIHGATESKLVYQLMVQGELKGHGKVRSGDVGVILRRKPDRLFGADALFVCNARLPVRTSREGYLETIPDLIGEVGSKNDRPGKVEGKVAKYLAAGVRLIWVLDPEPQTVTAFRPGEPPQVYGAADTLTADDVIPGFAVVVAELFRS